MTHLSDTRQTATRQAADTTPAAIGTALTELLTEHKDIEYATIRVTESSAECVSVSGRIGAIVGSRCPHCNGYWHEPDGTCIDGPRPPHTDPHLRDDLRTQARSAVLAAETVVVTQCPSCHTTAGHPHTDYCQAPNLPGDVDEHCHRCDGAGCEVCTTDPAQVRIEDLAAEGWTRLHPDLP